MRLDTPQPSSPASAAAEAIQGPRNNQHILCRKKIEAASTCHPAIRVREPSRDKSASFRPFPPYPPQCSRWPKSLPAPLRTSNTPEPSSRGLSPAKSTSST
ncbi:MAG: hypothetical protein FRX48_03433 [Lasallia pustulata]|uniref:Uncharacterized protein n=1 Tax=Lasallia pustulata TaxID=136370 RepID=A0A5M8PTU6_9LECA|nr:MAG: hypothetical protein FRX48_03433 [Lasallia pustulata]